MSEVKRISVFIHGPNRKVDMVEAVHLDRVTAERDAALAELSEIKESLAYRGSLLCRIEGQRDALQKRLNAADERNDQRDTEIAAQVESALRRSFSLGQIYWQQADSDSTCQQNKSDQTMEVQQQHILNVLESLGAALKPAEVPKSECPNCLGDTMLGCDACIPDFTPGNGNKARRRAAAIEALKPENQRIVPVDPFTICLGCFGSGTICTGILEASSTICNGCNGTGREQP